MRGRVERHSAHSRPPSVFVLVAMFVLISASLVWAVVDIWESGSGSWDGSASTLTSVSGEQIGWWTELESMAAADVMGAGEA